MCLDLPTIDLQQKEKLHDDPSLFFALSEARRRASFACLAEFTSHWWQAEMAKTEKPPPSLVTRRSSKRIAEQQSPRKGTRPAHRVHTTPGFTDAPDGGTESQLGSCVTHCQSNSKSLALARHNSSPRHADLEEAPQLDERPHGRNGGGLICCCCPPHLGLTRPVLLLST